MTKRLRQEFVATAHCPDTIPLGIFGLWQIERVTARSWYEAKQIGFPDLTILSHMTEATLHQARGEVVMEDSKRELRRHWPVWRDAHGRVLVTGLGLGCVIRGLLLKSTVTDIVVIERDCEIIKRIWPEFRSVEKLLLLESDALECVFPPGTRFDFAWHDIWREGEEAALLHAKLMTRYFDIVAAQGAWGMPAMWRKSIGGDWLRADARRIANA
jgi:hypothetical protein